MNADCTVALSSSHFTVIAVGDQRGLGRGELAGEVKPEARHRVSRSEGCRMTSPKGVDRPDGAVILSDDGGPSATVRPVAKIDVAFESARSDEQQLLCWGCDGKDARRKTVLIPGEGESAAFFLFVEMLGPCGCMLCCL